ncbi:putative RDD family membrane protein YckC [Silicimonas algicola]|uniref:Putative RDD family membrane protein YckC n=2 Tax=Silicimonas algicola TaxID=1826607 RepID=A0A316G9Y4_9RHOB|nr:putative RDD family membrane protein YckC [Silicimonas algicola]
MDMTHDIRTGLPDPDTHPEFYDDVPVKRLMAWVVDVGLIAVVTAAISVFTLFLAPLFLPLFLVVGFLYRWMTISGGSATLGMRLMAIELRAADGERLDGLTAFLHVAGYTVSVITFPLQLISIVLILTTARKQGLTDMVLGTAAINRHA